MPKKIALVVLFTLAFSAKSFAFWIWTPETNKWVNPKYAVLETPAKQLEFAKGFLDLKDYKKATAEFNKLIKYYPKAKEAPEAQYYIGSALEAQGRSYEAFKAYQTVIDKYPFSERSSGIVEQQYNIGIRIMEGEVKKGIFTGGLIGGDYDVVEVFRTIIKNSPYGKYAAPSQYKIGLYLQEKQLLQEARDEFEKVINDYPNSEWARAAKYQTALSDAQRSSKPQYDQKVTQSAVEEFKDFVKRYPDAELSAKAHQEIGRLREKEAENNFVIARFYEKQKNLKAAKVYYNAVVDNFQNTTWAPKALVELRRLNEKKQ